MKSARHGAIRAANTQLEADGQVPIPIGSGRGKSLNQHGLRHTHISLRLALGDDLMRIASDVGHESIEVTMRVYTHLMSLDARSRERLAEIVNGGSIGGEFRHISAPNPETDSFETCLEPTRPAGFEPAASRSGGGRSIH